MILYLDMTTRTVVPQFIRLISRPLTMVGPSWAEVAIGTSSSAKDGDGHYCPRNPHLDPPELRTNPAWHKLDRPSRPSHRWQTRTRCSSMPRAGQGSKIPGRVGHSQALFYCHGIPGASVKWESSKIITAFRLGAQWHRVTKDKTPTSVSTNPEPCLLLASEIA